MTRVRSSCSWCAPNAWLGLTGAALVGVVACQPISPPTRDTAGTGQGRSDTTDGGTADTGDEVPARFELQPDAWSLDTRGPSYGIAWGDPNGDGWPDAWVGNHAERASLFLNQRDGSFVESHLQWADARRSYTYDAHGIAWLDLDGDGDEDLIEAVGAGQGVGRGPNYVHRNLGGRFEDATADLDLGLPQGSGRCVVPFDADLDGRTDLLFVNQARADGLEPTSVRMQGADGRFTRGRAWTPAEQHGRALCGTLADLDGDGRPELVRIGRTDPLSAHAAVAPLFPDRTAALGLPEPGFVFDAAVADLDGDLRPDLVFARGHEASVGTPARVGTGLDLGLYVRAGSRQTVSFEVDGPVNVTVDPPYFWAPADLRLGSSCASATTLSVTSQPDDPIVQGACDLGTEVQHVAVGRTGGRWTVSIASPVFQRANLRIRTDTPPDDVVWDGINARDDERTETNRPHVYVRRDGAYVEEGAPRGFDAPMDCHAVVPFDVDNDMDLDLYLVCATPTRNVPNRLFVNDGTGHFTEVEDHGAEGSVLGRADTAAYADVDRDGWLDLLVTHGRGAPPFADGPVELFRRRPGSAHWIQIDLQGTVSTPEGWGATVDVVAGGVVQRRLVGNIHHDTAQHQRRLHLGLGPHETVDQIVVRWPDGHVQRLEDVSADQVLTIREDR